MLQRQTAAVPHVLHFDGHGFFGKRCNEAGCRKAYKQGTTQCECGSPLAEPQGYLVFEQSDGTADYISAQELGELLGNLERREQPNSEPGIALVVLSGCRTGMSRLSESVFNGVAQNLIGRGIPAVVAMQYSISVAAASAFAEEFYHSLKQKDSLVSALRQGQRAIGIEGNEWYRPALYLRWEDHEGGQLFKASPVQSGKASQGSPSPPVKASENQPSSNAVQLNNEQLQKRQHSRFQRLELERLTTELDDLERDYEKVKSQLRTELDGSTQNKLERQLEQIGQEMAQREQQLDKLKQGDD